jgi:hypothetical protein
MTNKINLLVSNNDLNSFCSDWFVDIISDYCNIIYEHETVNHSPSDTVCVTDFFNTNATWYVPYVNKGYKLVVDCFWDNDISKTSEVTDRLSVRNKNWIWYNESLWYRHLKYHKYVPNRNHAKAFLMLMHLKRSHRDQIYLRLQNSLKNAMYSYVQNGIKIKDDVDYANGDWQRYFNPNWYDATEFSVVVETFVTSPPFISEKIFKPIAYQHPFIVWGSKDTLKYLHEQGFETFDHLIDESYDLIENENLRLDKIVSEITRLTNEFENKNYIFEDTLTKQKLAYNHARFFDKDLVKQKIKSEIIDEILNYLE